MIPELRITPLTSIVPKTDRQFVVYWMTAYRRTRFNFALQRAIEWANRLAKPLLIVEAIRFHYRWNCDRFHRFMIDGMLDNASAIQPTRATYYPYVEPQAGAAKGFIETLARDACVVVTDDFPAFFHPTLYQRIVKRFPTAVELIDSNGLLPMRVADRTFTVAHSYRRFMQKNIAEHLGDFPDADPLSTLKAPRLNTLPAWICEWPAVPRDVLADYPLHSLDIDHSVPPIDSQGGSKNAQKTLEQFLDHRLLNYGDDRNEPSKSGSSGLSSYLHFGHLSAHEVFLALAEANRWSPARLRKPNGKATGFWDMDPSSEAFLDQLMTWREIGFNMCWREPNYDRYESLPLWAQTTLAEHASDRREHVYDLEQFESASTHDELWNAAQRQLVRDGIIHNYLRMLWGKKILHWSQSPREALHIMIHLNNKFAIDGRDPNSYSGIFWVLGRYDRAWGPERPIFGKIRYMTSESTRSKYRVKEYLERFKS